MPLPFAQARTAAGSTPVKAGAAATTGLRCAPDAFRAAAM
jgi:hypothetical protein